MNSATGKKIPGRKQYSQWKSQNNELDMSLSSFGQTTTKIKVKFDLGFELNLDHDESWQELQAQLKSLKEALEQDHNGISKLENEAIRIGYDCHYSTKELR